MYELVATAIRTGESIQITMNGILRNSSWNASVTGTYPGGIVHVTDPGYAEVYLDEYETPSSPISLRTPMPWSATVNIHDPKHNEVVIFVNKHEKQSISVVSMPTQFEVYAFKGSAYWGTVIVPAGHTMGTISHRIFGPASHEECVHWVDEHAKINFF